MRLRQGIVVLLFAWLVPLLHAACDDDGGGGGDWRSTAYRIVDTMCSKFYSCLSAAELEALRGFMPTIGASEAECRANHHAEIDRDTQPCQGTEVYHADMAERCLAETSAMTCEQLRASPDTPDSCEDICTPAS